MKVRQALFFLLVNSALFLQACGANTESAVQTGVAQALQIAELQTAAAGGGGGGVVASDTPQPGVPADTPTITPSIPYVSVSADTNCRTGPSQFYAYVVTVTVGQQLEVVATFPNSDYVIVKQPDGTGNCWLWLRYATTTDFSAYNLPAATQPPTPFPTATATNTPIAFDWNGTWTTWLVGNSGSPYTVAINQSGSSISGSFSVGPNITVTLSGSLSGDHQTATGTYTVSGGVSGTFQWQAVNENQFAGNWDGIYPWCGARDGASMPSPCQWP